MRAKDGVARKPLSKLRRRMFAALGPKPRQEAITPELEPNEPGIEDIRALLARLGSTPGLQQSATSAASTQGSWMSTWAKLS